MILVTGSLIARPETQAELRQLRQEHSARSRMKPGGLSHDVHLDCETPLRLVFLERWVDLDPRRVHFGRSDAWGFMKAARALAAGGSAVEILETTPVSV